MWDQFLILPFDTKKKSHTKNPLWSSPTKCLICTFFYKQKNQSSWSNICKEIFPTQFSDLFSIMDLISIFFAQPGDFFPTDLFHPKKSPNWKKFLYNNCSTELRSHTRKIPLPKKSKFEDTYYALNRTKKTFFTQIFSIFLVPKSIEVCFFDKIELWKTQQILRKKVPHLIFLMFFECNFGLISSISKSLF